MAYYKECPHCGCNLDFGEKCDCQKKEKKAQEFFSRQLKVNRNTGQLAFVFDSREVRYESKNCL